jgi:hypothetical protein
MTPLGRKRKRPGRRSKRSLASMSSLTIDGGSTEGIEDLFELPETVVPEQEPSVASWITEALHGQPWPTVRGTVPSVFEAYARILHPAHRGPDRERRANVSWAEIAAATGRTLHRLAQFERIAAIDEDPNTDFETRPHADGVCDIAPSLTPILREYTSSNSRCVFGLWEGYGGMDKVPSVVLAARARCPHRDYALFAGPIEGFFAFCRPHWQPPSIWWPEDRAWFVFTDIDLDSTYVGGSVACISRILEDPSLEAFPALPDDRIDIGADEINPAGGHDL